MEGINIGRFFLAWCPNVISVYVYKHIILILFRVVVSYTGHKATIKPSPANTASLTHLPHAGKASHSTRNNLFLLFTWPVIFTVNPYPTHHLWHWIALRCLIPTKGSINKREVAVCDPELKHFYCWSFHDFSFTKCCFIWRWAKINVRIPVPIKITFAISNKLTNK